MALTTPGCGASQTRTIRSGWGNGRGLRSTASSTLNMATLAPIPSASTLTTTAVKPGARRSDASPYRRSLSEVSIHRKLRSSRCSSFIRSIPPKRRRTARRASSGDRPRAMASLSANSRWARISFSSSRSRRCRRTRASRRSNARRTDIITAPESEPPGRSPSPSSPPQRGLVSFRPGSVSRISLFDWSPKCPSPCGSSLPVPGG